MKGDCHIGNYMIGVMKEANVKTMILYISYLVLIVVSLGLLTFQNITFIKYLLDETYVFSSFYTQLNLFIFIIVLCGIGTLLMFVGIDVLAKLLTIMEQKSQNE